MPDLPEVEISHRAARRVAAGHLWVYSNEAEAPDGPSAPAFWCRFVRGGRTVATGYFNRHSLIAGRVVAAGGGDAEPEALLRERLRAAFRRRMPAPADRALRLVYAEADLLPGLIVDRYPPHLVLQCSTAGMDLMLAFLEACLPAVHAEFFGGPPAGLVLRCDAPARAAEGVPRHRRVVFGDPRALAEAVVLEDGVRYVADLVNGQKTGFFLDQRENRFRLAEFVRERPAPAVLDLYCYSGGWGLRALAAGAGRVTFVDQSREALDLLEKGLAANAFPRERARLVEAEVFDHLRRDPESYAVVVADPPAFVKSRKNLPQARQAYLKLNRLAWRRLSPGGVLLTSSCSHLLAEADFLDLLAEAVAKEGGLAQVVHRGRQPDDHPVLLSMPETAYLKCAALRRL